MKSSIYYLKECNGLSRISRFFLFLTLLSVIVDPTNQILRIKDLSFIAFILCSIKECNFKEILKYLSFIVIYFISYSFQLLFPSCYVDFGTAMSLLKAFIYLSIIFWMGKNQELQVFKWFFYINFFVALFCLVIWTLIMMIPSLEMPLYLYFMRNENYTVIISHRSFIGIKIFGVFYKTCVFSVVCLAYSVYQFFMNKRKIYIVFCIVFFLYLLASGTRANMLSSILIVGGVYSYYLYKRRKFAMLSFVLCVGGACSLFLILKLLSDTGESSIAIKSLHKESYWDLFTSNCMRYLLIGDGPGSTFYSKGRQEIVLVTELSYYELIRNYGFIFTLIIIILFLDPLINIYNRYKKGLFFPIMLSYFAYLFIAGTNPYLIGSTGFTTIAIMYYIGNHNIEMEMNRDKK